MDIHPNLTILCYLRLASLSQWGLGSW